MRLLFIKNKNDFSAATPSEPPIVDNLFVN